jgi:hypothetical protein
MRCPKCGDHVKIPTASFYKAGTYETTCANGHRLTIRSTIEPQPGSDHDLSRS